MSLCISLGPPWTSSSLCGQLLVFFGVVKPLFSSVDVESGSKCGSAVLCLWMRFCDPLSLDAALRLIGVRHFKLGILWLCIRLCMRLYCSLFSNVIPSNNGNVTPSYDRLETPGKAASTGKWSARPSSLQIWLYNGCALHFDIGAQFSCPLAFDRIY